MACHWVLGSAEDRVAGGESAENRVILAGTEVILVELAIPPLASEQEAVIKRAAFFEHLAKWAICVICHDRACIINYLPDRA